MSPGVGTKDNRFFKALTELDQRIEIRFYIGGMSERPHNQYCINAWRPCHEFKHRCVTEFKDNLCRDVDRVSRSAVRRQYGIDFCAGYAVELRYMKPVHVALICKPSASTTRRREYAHTCAARQVLVEIRERRSHIYHMVTVVAVNDAIA